jgi:chorismate synthase
MKNTFGNAIGLTLFGESHGTEIGFVLDGLAPGLAVSEESIAAALFLRRPSGKISTPRQEKDAFRIVSGVYQEKTTGTPLCILIPNENKNSRDYKDLPYRPGHADFTAQMRYRGFQDPRGGGHFSGRLTAPLVAAGAILLDALAKKGIFIGTHIKECAGVSDRDFSSYPEDLASLRTLSFPVLEEDAAEEMNRRILEAKEDLDSVGGILETAVIGLPAGIGEPWFDSLESCLSHGIFSIPAVKGLEFGDGFDLARMRGSLANDAFSGEGGRVVTKTNHNGGLNGGITNGMPLLFRSAIKPTPTISLPQETFDPKTGENVTVSFGGRHDPCIVHRAGIVQTSVTALVIADALAVQYGTHWLNSGEKE